MESFMQNADLNPTRWRVSVLIRLAAVAACGVPLFGGAIGAMMMTRTMIALKNSQSAGIVALMTAVKEAALPVTISLYIAAFLCLLLLAIVVFRTFNETKTASSPIWLFLIFGALSLVPAALFWRAEWLIVQVLTPGSEVAAAAGGISAVGEQVATLLIFSWISAPIIFVLFAIAAAVPFSLKSKSNGSAMIGAGLVLILLIAAAVASPWIVGEPQRKKETVSLPVDVKGADEDSDIIRETSVVVVLTSDNRLFIEKKKSPNDSTAKTEEPVSFEEFERRLAGLMRDKTPEKWIVYLKADVNADCSNVLKLFESIRKNEVAAVGIVVYGEDKPEDPYQIYPKRFELKLPEPVNPEEGPRRPNPLALLATLENGGSLSLNKEPMGTAVDPKNLSARLKKVFQQRESEGIFREGTNEIEKTVMLTPSPSAKYGDFVKLIETVKLSGAEPVMIQMDSD